MGASAELKQRFMAAVDSFIEKVKTDKNVIALILIGSLSYDKVWEKSDIDSVLVVRDQPLDNTSFCLYEDDLPLNVQLVTRSGLKRMWERSLDGSFGHSFVTTSTIVYTTDDSLYDYLEDLKAVGKDDMALSLMYIATDAMYFLEKCRKWLAVKDDPAYSQFWLLKGSEAVARMVICQNYETANREAVLRAMEINPELIKRFYITPMSRLLTKGEIEESVAAMEEYISASIDIYSAPMLEHLSDGDIHTLSEIAKHFRTQSHFIFHFLDYLCDRGLVEKVSKTISVTPKSRKAVEEMAFMRIML